LARIARDGPTGSRSEYPVIPDAHGAGDPESIFTPLKLKMDPGLRQDDGGCGGRRGADGCGDVAEWVTRGAVRLASPRRPASVPLLSSVSRLPFDKLRTGDEACPELVEGHRSSQ
jgi:hypothetical protein